MGKINYQYDKSKRINALHSQNWNQSNISYNKVGLLTSQKNEDSIGVQQYTFAYDGLDHLIEEAGHETHTYKSDSIHNRVAKDKVQYHVNELNQLDAQGKINYAYDKSGNLTSKNENGEIASDS